MAQRIYLTLAETVEIHRQLIEEFGGSLGLRSEAGLEAAIFRPQTGYYGDLIEEAASLMESLVNNHAFVDGNKRVSFAASDTFLRLNGFYLDVESAEAADFIVGQIAAGTFRFRAIKEWITLHIKPLGE